MSENNKDNKEHKDHSFIDIFIRRPVLSIVTNLMILLAGLWGVFQLNVREYPKLQSAVVTVTTPYYGASADAVRGYITTPLEREIASADGIDYMSSSSAGGLSTVTARLRLNFDPNEALTQITSKVNKAKGELPREAENSIIDVAVGESFAAIYLSFASDTLDSNQITDYLSRVVQPKLATVPGVQRADILGARTFAMRVWIKPDKLTAYGISPSELREVLTTQNYLSAVGSTKGAWTISNLNAQTDLRTAEEFKQLIVKEKDGKVVRLGDVADVVLGAEDYNTTVKMGSQNATFIGVYGLPTANVIDVVKGVRKAFTEIKAQLPPGLMAVIPYDSTIYINDSIKEVVKTLIEAMIIVSVVIYLFLGSIRSVLIPVVAIPLSLIGGMFLMYAMGFSLNLLTLLAMVLAIGLVVDDAIVVVENITRHIKEGKSPLQAALQGGGELVGPVIAMTITLVAVYAPIGLQTGLTGALFKEFAFTLAGAVVVSGVVGLTLTHMMCSKILKPNEKRNRFVLWLDGKFEQMRAGYVDALRGFLNNRRPIYIATAILAIAIVPFYIMSQKELAPTEDRGFMMSIAQTQPNASIEQTETYSNRLIKAMETYKESQQVFAISGIAGQNVAFIGTVLKPSGERHRTTQQFLPDFQKELGSITGLNGGAFIPPSLPGAGEGLPVQYVVTSTAEPQRVAEIAEQLLQKAIASGKFYFGDTDLKFDLPQTDIVIDRDKAAALGINMQKLGADLGVLLGGGYVNRFAIEGRSYKVTPQVTRLRRLSPEQLETYYIATAKGDLVPLSTVAKLKESVQPRELKRFQQLNAATISLLPANGVSLGDAYDFLNTEAKKIFPEGFNADTAGELRQYVKEGNNLLVSFVLALIVIYLVLAAQFNSFRDPLVILMSVPLALTGAMAFIFAGLATINIYTQVGLITLVGLIAKNGILIVEFANEMRIKGKDAMSAIMEAAATRLRPILMTTSATVFGVLPLLLAHGPGAQSRFSIGLTIATGMSIGTLFTLFVVPVFYMLISTKDTARFEQAKLEEKL